MISIRGASSLLLAGICFSSWAFSGNPGELTGRVLDKATHHPIPGANITLGGAGLGASANSAGYFEVKQVPPGEYSVEVSVLGYIPVTRDLTLREGEQKVLTFELNEMVYELNPVTVTATREASLLSEVPSSVDVVSSRELESRNIQNISQAVQTLQGVTTRDYGSLGDLKTVSIRGSTSSQVLVLVDGQPVNNAQSGDVDLGTIPMAGIERIEVMRGGASALYGADAVGGVINVITKAKLYRASTEANAKVLAGSFGTRGFEGTGTFSSGRSFSTIAYKYLASKGDFIFHAPNKVEITRSNGDLTSHGLFAKETWSLSEEALSKILSLSGQYFYSQAGVPGSTGYATPYARSRNRNGLFNLVYEQNVTSPDNYVRVQSFYHNFEYQYDDPTAPDQSSSNHNVAWGSELQGRTALNDWGVVTSGLAYRGDGVSSTSIENKRSRALFSIYVQDEALSLLPQGGIVDRIVVLPAVRWDHFSDFGGQVSPKVGLMASTGESWRMSLKSNFGTSFRAPSFNDLYWKDAYSQGNADLKPERGRDYDIGLTFRHPSFFGMTADLTYFNNSVEDLILWQTDANYFSTPQNVGKASIKGLEAKAAVSTWKDLLSVELNYTFMDARNRAMETDQYDKQLPYRARHQYNLSARTRFFGISFLASLSYVGERYTNAANTLSLPPYHVSGLLFGYKPQLGHQWLDMKLEVKNLENLEYQIMDGFPMPGRELRFSVEVQFSHDNGAE